MPVSQKEFNLQRLKEQCFSCKECALSQTRKNIVFSDGSSSAKILLIGEAPGADEDEIGKPFVGRAGKLLNSFLEKAGIIRETELYICNTIKCRPPNNRVPSPSEKNACITYLLKQIELVNPKVIILCGRTAMETFYSKKEKISAVRGKWIKILDNRDAMVIFHPSYLLRNHKNEINSPRWHTLNDLIEIKEAVKPKK